MSRQQKIGEALSSLMRMSRLAPVNAATAFNPQAYRRNIQEQEDKKANETVNNLVSDFNRNGAMPSAEEFVRHHARLSSESKDLKTYLTTDKETLVVAKRIVKNQKLESQSEEFLEKLILGEKSAKSDEKGSMPVYIAPIEDSEYESAHQEYLSTKTKERVMAVGGPAAEDQILLSSFIPSLREKINSFFISAGWANTNQSNSAMQVHARHGNALNADSALTGHALLSKLLQRELIKIIVGPANELRKSIEEPDYRKIHVKFTLDPRKLKIYLGNEINWAKQKFRKDILKEQDQHDLNRLESVLSAEIMRAVEKELSENLGTDFKIIEGNERKVAESSSIHTALTEEEHRETISENKHLQGINIESIELSKERIDELFGKNHQIFSAFSYQGDGQTPATYHQDARDVVTKIFNQEWLEPAVVTKILTYNKNGNAALAGVIALEDGKERFIPLDKMHFTGGYMAKLMYENPLKESVADWISKMSDLAKTMGIEISEDARKKVTQFINTAIDVIYGEATTQDTTVATGVSVNAILKRTPEINKFLEEFGTTGQIAVVNSHWTMFAKDDEHVIVRITGGGNTGSEEYNPNYFLNVIANTNRIFSDALVGIIRSYGCPRSINAINSTVFEEIAEGLVVSYGKGGTGNTKRFSEAAIGLALLGYEKEVVQYFSKFEDYKGSNMGEEIAKMIRDFKNESDFLLDSKSKTRGAMGYQKHDEFFANYDFEGFNAFSCLEEKTVLQSDEASNAKFSEKLSPSQTPKDFEATKVKQERGKTR